MRSSVPFTRRMAAAVVYEEQTVHPLNNRVSMAVFVESLFLYVLI